jgi:hypothetical protein
MTLGSRKEEKNPFWKNNVGRGVEVEENGSGSQNFARRNSYRLDPRDRIVLEFSRPMRTVLERFQREDGGWDLKVTLFELDDDSWEKRSR